LFYSGQQASNLWGLFLVPIYTACVLLDDRSVAWTAGGAIACNAIYHMLATPDWNSAVYFEVAVQSAFFALASATPWKLLRQERSSQQMLSHRSAALERTENYMQLFRKLVGQMDDAILVVNPGTGHMVDINGTL